MIPKRKSWELSKEAVPIFLFGVLPAVVLGMFAHASPAQERIAVPAGSTLIVMIDQALNSQISQAGQAFSATVARPVMVNRRTVLMVNRRTVIPKGSPVTGTVVTTREQSKVKGDGELGELALSLTSITIYGWKYPIHTHTLNLEGQSKARTTRSRALGGAVLAGLAGGGEGAGVGRAVGGSAGMDGGSTIGNKQVEIPAESELPFTLSEPLDSLRPREVNTTVIH